MGYLARALSALTLAAGLALSTQAAAATLLQFHSIDGPAVEWTRAEDGLGGTLRQVPPRIIIFSFGELSPGAGLDPALQNLGAFLQLNLTQPADSQYFSGTFDFVYQGATRDWSGGELHSGASLLSGNINSGLMLASSFAAPFFAYQGLGDFDMNLASSIIQDFDEPDGFTALFMNLVPDQPIQNGGLPATPSFKAEISGRLVSGIPEPSTWAFLIVGFGLAGAALRARPKSSLT